MKLTETQKDAIRREYAEWVGNQYAGNSKAERKKLDQFYTPPELTIALIEKFDSIENQTILDPTSGAGGLLIGCYFAGADITKLYGIELDKNILENICWKRFDRIIDNDSSISDKAKVKAIIRDHIHYGDALNPDAYYFDETY